MVEVFFYLIILAIVFLLLLGPIVLSLVAIVRSRRIVALTRRMERLEELVRALQTGRPDSLVTAAPRVPATQPAPEPVAADAPLVEVPPAPAVAPFDWEWFIGRRALGWVAVVLIVFTTAFFLRYAFENNWIGPIGRVALAAAAGLALVVTGWHYEQHRGWRLFSQMLTAAGVVLFYLAAYSAFGFYHLLPQRSAALFLLIIVVETMVLAVQYEAPALALVAVVGGLLTPVLMHSETDQYTALFLYLGMLNVGVVVMALRRPWPVVTTVALLGTQLLFWGWYRANYHPEKLGAALTFQVAVFLLYLGQGLAVHVLRPRPARHLGGPRTLAPERLLRVPGYLCLAGPRLWRRDGDAGVGLGGGYAGLARWILIARPDDERLFLTTLAIATGLIAAAFPIQAEAPWIALGWAAEASALWWFGLRVRQPPLRGLAAVLALMATIRVVFFDTLGHTEAPELPVFNRFALPAIGASACLLAAVGATRRLQHGLLPAERLLTVAAEVGGTLQLWLILSVDLYVYCQASFGTRGTGDDRFAQMALSVLWAIYATTLLVVGFRFHRARLRWTALGLYGVTVAKVFLLDMAGLDEIFRILAFLVLAILLGVAAGVYQRIRPEREKPMPDPTEV